MTDYRLTGGDTVVRTVDGAFIPNDPANADWMEYQKWLTEGGVPDPWVEPPAAVPASISDRQFFQQLAVLSIIGEDEALAACAAVIPAPLVQIIDGLPEDQRFSARMLLSGATVFERNHSMTEAIGTAYGWTSEQVDDFFRAAALL